VYVYSSSPLLLLQSITTDSRLCEGAPPRLVGDENPRNHYNSKHRRYRNNRPPKLDKWFSEYPEEKHIYEEQQRHASGQHIINVHEQEEF
jgi:hypothetical protein